MAGAVGDKRDQIGMGCAFRVAIIQQGADHFDQLKIADLVLAPDVIAAAQCAFGQHGQQRIGVVFDNTRLSYNQGASSTASYALYATGKGNNFMTAVASCGGYPLSLIHI